ncbi:MAG: hypothetical protein ACI4K5_09330 [Ruminococcus sp.]
MKNFEKDFEKNLSDKMSELSDNVNCFDRIAKKAFPENNGITEDGYYSESGLENVTGRKHFPFAPVLTVAFAIFIGSLLIMQSSIKEFFYQMKQNNGEYYNTFADIKSELDYELENFTYIYYDLSFDEYQMNIGCINPLAECPLIKEDEDTKVRVYTKIFTVGNQKTETNQIYLVHYLGEYCDENIISITDSTAKFSNNDKDNATFFPQYNITWQNVVNPSPYSDFYYPPADDMQNMFEINYHFLYKEQESGKVYNLLSSGIFWFDESDTNQDIKHYDIVSIYNPNTNSDTLNFDGQYETVDNSIYEFYDVQNLWNETVYQYDEHTGFDDVAEDNYFIRENISESITQKDIFLDNYIYVNDGSSSSASPNYERQIINNQRTLEVKIPVRDNSFEKIIKIAEYSNNISSSEIYENNIIKLFSQENIQKLNDYDTDFIQKSETVSNEADALIKEQIESSDKIAELQAKSDILEAQIVELEKNGEDTDELYKELDSIDLQINEFDAEISKIAMQTALDYIKNNFKYSDNMRDLSLYVSFINSYNYNQTEYYIYSYFDLSDTEYYYKAEAYFDVFQDNCEYRIQGVDIKIYFPPNIYKF